MTTTMRTPASMTPRHLRGRVSSRILVAGKWQRAETEQARLAIFGREAVAQINSNSLSQRQEAARAQMARLLS